MLPVQYEWAVKGWIIFMLSVSHIGPVRLRVCICLSLCSPNLSILTPCVGFLLHFSVGIPTCRELLTFPHSSTFELSIWLHAALF